MHRPIQKRLLIHDVIYREKTDDEYLGAVYKEDVQVSNVRVLHREKELARGNDDVVVANHMMFMDVFYTKPEEVLKAIKVEDVIIYQGRELKVAEVQKLYDDSRLHHLEVWLNG